MAASGQPPRRHCHDAGPGSSDSSSSKAWTTRRACAPGACRRHHGIGRAGHAVRGAARGGRGEADGAQRLVSRVPSLAARTLNNRCRRRPRRLWGWTCWPVLSDAPDADDGDAPDDDVSAGYVTGREIIIRRPQGGGHAPTSQVEVAGQCGMAGQDGRPFLGSELGSYATPLIHAALRATRRSTR